MLMFLDNRENRCNYFPINSLRIWNNSIVANYHATEQNGEITESYDVLLTKDESPVELKDIFTYLVTVYSCRMRYELISDYINKSFYISENTYSNNPLLHGEFLSIFSCFISRGLVYRKCLLEFGKDISAEEFSKYLTEFVDYVTFNYLY